MTETDKRGASPRPRGLADAVRRREPDVGARIAAHVLPVRGDNMIARPWGGQRLASFKGIAAGGQRHGETFELAACRYDAEANAHPSIVLLPDGSEIALPTLLDCAGGEILGDALFRVGGPNLPILPKLLDIEELLSVQAHPPGNPEAYLVLEAAEGATIRLGFRRDVRADELHTLWYAGRKAQERLLGLLRSEIDLAELQDILGRHLAERTASASAVLRKLTPLLRAGADATALVDCLLALKETYWESLDLLNEIPVRAGQVILNATLPDGGRRPRAAEVHALGNPEKRAILLLEVRRPAPTMRAWDHVRFPLRTLDVDGAIAALDLAARAPEGFFVEPQPVAGRPGLLRSVACEWFEIEHLRPSAGTPVALPGHDTAHSLHVVRGDVHIETEHGQQLALARGASALVPAGVGAYRVAGVNAEVVRILLPPHVHCLGSPALAGKRRNLEDLRHVVRSAHGPKQVIAVVNGGDAELVARELEGQRSEIFRADGHVTILAHEERARRGQLLGLLDALRHWREAHGLLAADDVALGIMLPGRGTRLSPLTQRLFGIKPFLPTLIRTGRDSRTWCTGAAASVYTWSLVTHHLRRMGFRGIAWKWGDEPQIPAEVLASSHLDLRDADAVRFGARTRVTEDLARNKEWLLSDPATGRLLKQVRRRPRRELLTSLGIEDRGQEVRALIHIGSPAFSHMFLEEAERVFGGLSGAIDVDGWLFEALTHDERAWGMEVERDAGLRAMLAEHPDFYARVQDLARAVAARRGHPLVVKVIDFGEALYWGDIGQLDKARRAFLDVIDTGEVGHFARALAAIDHVIPDAWGNRVVGGAQVPPGGSVKNSVLVDAVITGDAKIDGAVIVDSELRQARLGRGTVVVGSTVVDLETGDCALLFRSIAERLRVPAGFAHTSIPVDPSDVTRGLEDWWADARSDPGQGTTYTEPQHGNPLSHAAKFEQMRGRATPPTRVELQIDTHFRQPLRQRIRGGG